MVLVDRPRRAAAEAGGPADPEAPVEVGGEQDAAAEDADADRRARATRFAEGVPGRVPVLGVGWG